MTFLQNCEVCFNQESLPIPYHSFRYKRLVRPNRKLSRISTNKLQGKFLQRDKMHLADHKKRKLITKCGRKLRSDPYLHLKWPKSQTYILHGWFSYKTVVLILAKKVTKNLTRFLQQKFGQTQQQIFNLPKILIHKLHGQFSTER